MVGSSTVRTSFSCPTWTNGLLRSGRISAAKAMLSTEEMQMIRPTKKGK
jgi:hypothetical protein